MRLIDADDAPLYLNKTGVEQIKKMPTVNLKPFLEQLKWERDIALAQLEEIGVGLGAKMDDIKAAVEKQVKRQWEHEEGLYGERLYTCPVCNDTFVLTNGTMQDNNYNHCPACGQRLEDWDWSEEEWTKV